jgi:hypothetical protein
VDIYVFFLNLKYKHRNYKWGRPQDPMNVDNEHVDSIVIGNYYYKDLALDMDIYPNMTLMFFQDNKLWRHIMFSTIHPIIFRLKGEFKLKNARKYIYNIISYNKLQNIKFWRLYMMMFLIFHLIFIASIVLVSTLITFILKKNNIISTYNYIYLFTILFILYTYSFWY